MVRLKAEFTRFNRRGEACGTAGGRKIAAYGVIPGEKAEVFPLRRKQKPLSCLPVRILAPAPCRIPPREKHYLSCSPWQVISYEFQTAFKSDILGEIFREVAGENIRPEHFFPSPRSWGYRTKMEFSFALESGKLMLAFNERGSPYRKTVLPRGCALAGEKLNSAALSLAALFNDMGLTGGVLKTLTVRESKSTGKIISALAVKDENFRFGSLLPELPPLGGFIIFYSDPKSPSSVVSRILCARGDDFLEEEINGKMFSYGFDGFFQNNIPQFKKAVEIISGSMSRTPRIVELYSGAGAIGVLLGRAAAEVTGIEASGAGARHAELNARRNGAGNFKTLEMAAEKTPLEILKKADVLIMDPPRSGAAPKLLGRIEEAAPPLIAYLSCNPASQAADYSFIRKKYRASGLWGFDFCPQTPHIESLLLLERR